MTKISCPGCGAALELQSPATIFVVCGYCNTALVRDQDWQTYGKMAQLPAEASLLQIGTSGTFQGERFELIGRQKLQWENGYWTEWSALFPKGKVGWLAEAQGLLLLSFPAQLPEGQQAGDAFKISGEVAVAGKLFTIDDIKVARRVGSEGELPFTALPDLEITSIDANNPNGEFLGIEIQHGSKEIRAYLGRYVEFEELKFQNLRNLKDAEQLQPTLSAQEAKAESFNCIQCGFPIPVHRPGESLTFACSACGAVVQDDNSGKKILAQASQATRYKPLLELGAKTQFRGHLWQTLGFMVRSDEEEAFFWREYLLYNPTQGYRFLMEADGHWNFMFLTKKFPQTSVTNARWGGRNYRCFHVGKAKVQYVVGEFYWRVKVGDTTEVKDFVAPPDILSLEFDGTETLWTAGKYIPADDIQKAFKLIGKMPQPYGVAPNQPSKFLVQRNSILLHWAGFVALLLVIHLVRSSITTDTVLSQSLERNLKPTTEQLLTKSFQVKDEGKNLALRLKAPLHESWLGISGKIVPDDGQSPVISFQRELASYGSSGDDDDYVRVTESELFFPRMAKGSYHLEFQLDRDPAQKVDASRWRLDEDRLDVVATIDPPLEGNLYLCLFLISIYPIFALLRDIGFENKRWSESNQMHEG